MGRPAAGRVPWEPIRVRAEPASATSMIGRSATLPTTTATTPGPAAATPMHAVGTPAAARARRVPTPARQASARIASARRTRLRRPASDMAATLMRPTGAAARSTAAMLAAAVVMVPAAYRSPGVTSAAPAGIVCLRLPAPIAIWAVLAAPRPLTGATGPGLAGPAPAATPVPAACSNSQDERAHAKRRRAQFVEMLNMGEWCQLE